MFTRRTLFATILAFFSTKAHAATVDDTVFRNVLDFEKVWDQFVRALFGCPAEGPVTKETCNPSLGRLDYGAFAKARKAARKVFDFPQDKDNEK